MEALELDACVGGALRGFGEERDDLRVRRDLRCDVGVRGVRRREEPEDEARDPARGIERNEVGEDGQRLPRQQHVRADGDLARVAVEPGEGREQEQIVALPAARRVDHARRAGGSSR